ASGSAGKGGASGAGGAGAGGTSGGSGSGGSGGSDPMSTQCAGFPENVMLGASLQPNSFGAGLCFQADGEGRLPTHTFSDGTNPCDGPKRLINFGTLNSQNTADLPSTWHWVSASAGTIDATYKYDLKSIPSGTSVTAVLESPGAVQYTIVFQFGTAPNF